MWIEFGGTMMDSKKSDNDARIKIFEAIENLCHSKDISAKEIAQLLPCEKPMKITVTITLSLYVLALNSTLS